MKKLLLAFSLVIMVWTTTCYAESLGGVALGMNKDEAINAALSQRLLLSEQSIQNNTTSLVFGIITNGKLDSRMKVVLEDGIVTNVFRMQKTDISAFTRTVTELKQKGEGDLRSTDKELSFFNIVAKTETHNIGYFLTYKIENGIFTEMLYKHPRQS